MEYYLHRLSIWYIILNPALVPWGLCDPSPLWLTFFQKLSRIQTSPFMCFFRKAFLTMLHTFARFCVFPFILFGISFLITASSIHQIKRLIYFVTDTQCFNGAERQFKSISTMMCWCAPITYTGVAEILYRDQQYCCFFINPSWKLDSEMSIFSFLNKFVTKSDRSSW